MSDPWETYDCDRNNCSLPDPDTGRYGPRCVSPWTDPSAWDPTLLPLLPLVRNE